MGTRRRRRATRGSRRERVAAARALRTDGLAHVEDVLDGATASALLAHVNRRLDCALAASADAATPQQRSAAIGGAAGGGGEALLGAIMCRSRRYDLKLDLDEPAVAAALSQLLGALGRPLVSLLGRAENGVSGCSGCASQRARWRCRILL